MTLSVLTALSPLDGRYHSKVASLRPYFSEFALIRHRVRVEIEWLKALSKEPAIGEVPIFSEPALQPANFPKPMRQRLNLLSHVPIMMLRRSNIFLKNG